MKRILTAVAALSMAAVITTVSPAVADSDVKVVATGSYHASTSDFRCVGQVHDDGNGGILSLTVRASERRLEHDHFRVASASTRIVAQEKRYNGKWVDVERGARIWGVLGPTIDEGAYNRSRVRFGGDTSPRLSLAVQGHDDLFRLKSITVMFDDEGNRIARLVNHEGNCRV